MYYLYKFMNNIEFRNYSDTDEIVKETYKKARINQTLEFFNKMKSEYINREKVIINITESLNLLNKFIDQSDPDINLPNIQHLFQSAEASRKDNQPDWFQLVCLIHDLGKIMYLFGDDETGTSIKEQWAVVGDTFILGCKIPDTIVYPEFNKLNSDHNNYDKFGIYSKNCGLENCNVSWGHDEFLYRTLLNNQNTLPQEALYIIRYHSLYLYHDKNEYEYLLNNYDLQMKSWLKLFNKYDLYSKNNELLNINELKNYYLNLFDKFFVSRDLFW